MDEDKNSISGDQSETQGLIYKKLTVLEKAAKFKKDESRMQRRGGKKNFKLPFNKRGGVIVNERYMLDHKNYLTLIPQAKVLMDLMHIHWYNEYKVDYGIREAAQKIPCASNTARKAFKQLEERGFITCKSPAIFSSRTECKTRSWRLNWMPWMDKKPTNEWEKWKDQN